MIQFKKFFVVVLACFISQLGYAAPNSQITREKQDVLHKLGEKIREKGYPEIKKLLGGLSNENVLGRDLPDSLSSEQNVYLIEDSKLVAASSDPTKLGQDVSKDPVIQEMITKLKASPEDKAVIEYKDENQQTRIAVAWGRKALMGDKTKDVKNVKFFCYISFLKEGV